MENINSETGVKIQATKVNDDDRNKMMPRYFGRKVLNVENFIYNVMNHLCDRYSGGYWEFFELSNGGFYMAPKYTGKLLIEAEGNYFSGEMTSDAAGIVACLYAFCYFAEEDSSGVFVNLYHNLRDYALDHAEAGLIFGAID